MVRWRCYLLDTRVGWLIQVSDEVSMTFRPYTKEDKLEVGTEFDFAGRKGTIAEDPDESRHLLGHKVTWEDGNTGYIDFTKFTSFLIKDIPPPHLTIDKRVKEEIIRIFKFKGFWRQTEGSMSAEVMAYLNSLEEV